MAGFDHMGMQKFLSIYRKALYWGAIILAEYHILWTLMQYVVWEKPYLKYGKWFGLALVLAALLYLIICAAASPESLKDVRGLLGRTKSPEQIFLAGVFFWYIFVCALRTGMDGKAYFVHNDNRLYYWTLSALLFFPFVEFVGRERIRKTVNVMLSLCLAAYTPVCAWVIWKYRQMELVTFPSGKYVQLYENNSLTMGSHRNITASYAIILLGACIYLVLTTRSKLRFLCIPAGAVHLLMVFLSNSRTSLVAMIAMIMIAVIMRGMNYLNIRNKAQVVLISAAVVVVGGLLLLFLRKGIFLLNAGQWQEILHDSNVMGERKFFDGLNGRLAIWVASVKIFFSSPDRFFFGVTPAAVRTVLNQIGQFQYEQPHCHNLFLQVGASFGVPVMLMYMWFVYSIIRRGLRVMMYRGSTLFRNAWTVPMIVFGLLLIEIMEVLTFVNRVTNLPVFFIFAGWIVAMDKALDAEKAKKSAEIAPKQGV